ncbi:hypothetical protein GHT06_008313 [Daphnia sinensis]|uniref:Uncharacterized protein n=1 Tax=Daphnia sinensis TaxID=1820382 RepID=A0AAD5LV22_9CRUS|nr:hypothetical protein GHT06_008313 [Daphnia sinensis]
MCCLVNVNEEVRVLVATRKRQLRIRQEKGHRLAVRFSSVSRVYSSLKKKKKENNSLFNV